MRISIIGAGSLGCLYGGLLAKAGHDVWLIHHRESFVDAVERNGLVIESEFRNELGRDSPIPISATTDATEVGEADLAMFFVKSHQTRTAARQHNACIGDGTVVLTLQNGLRNYDRLRELFTPEQVVGGVAYVGGVTEAPGRIRQTGDGRSVIGGPNDSAVERVIAAFEAANLETTVVDDPLPHIWDKQLLSLAIKPLAALTRLSNDRLVETDERLELMSAVVDEAATVARSKGIETNPDGVIEEILDVFKEGEGHKSSMLQDVEAERKTEIDEINGAVVDLAEEECIDVPYNWTLTTLVRGLEQGYL